MSVTERLTRIEDHLETLVESKKKQEELCNDHNFATNALRSRVEDLEHYRDHVETMTSTLSLTARTAWKTIGLLIGAGAAIVTVSKAGKTIVIWVRLHL